VVKLARTLEGSWLM